jgi:hypothetical protein
MLLGACTKVQEPAVPPARCASYQAMLGVDRAYVVDHYTMVAAPSAQLIPAEDEALVRRAVELWGDKPLHDLPRPDGLRVYVAAARDQRVAELAAWKATLPANTDARLIVNLDTDTRIRRFRANHPDLPVRIEERLYQLRMPEIGIPLVDAAGGCDQARTGLAMLKNGDADAAGKATAAGLAACSCRLADTDTFVYLAEWLLEPAVGWFPLTDEVLVLANDKLIEQMVRDVSR